MFSLTYLAVVAVVGALLWRVAVRARRARAGRPPVRPATAVARMRALVDGIGRPENDLVERMSDCLVEQTTTFGSSYAIPGHLGAELPKGVFEAASAARGQLTAEVLAHYRDAMTERCRRLGRPDFVLPAGYALRLTLTCGPSGTVVASFDPIDTPAALPAPLPVPEPLPVPVPNDGLRTRLRVPDPGAAELTVLLSVDGVPRARGRLTGAETVLTLGRGPDADLRCPDEVHEVSRRHVSLTREDDRVRVEDQHSANGTWVQRAGGDPVGLAPGRSMLLERGDVVWLDADHRTTVSFP